MLRFLVLRRSRDLKELSEQWNTEPAMDKFFTHWCVLVYVAIATLISSYQAGRGVFFQLKTAAAQFDVFKASTNAASTSPPLGAETRKQIWWSRAISDGLLYLFSTLAGFASLLLAYWILERIPCVDKISAGTASLLIFLVLFGILGVTAQLPHLLQEGKLTKWPN
jgi:hypothetical protein